MAAKIDLLVINDLVTDNRVHKVAQTLVSLGYQPRLIGRQRKKSLALATREYETRRLKLLFEKGPLFYIEFNLRLFFILLFSKAELFLANDLDTLAPAYFASKLKGRRLVYDSHELFTEVPELINRPRKQRAWKRLETYLLPKLNDAYTVCDSIADYYREQYGTRFKVLRNVPYRIEPTSKPPSDEKTEKIILYQGALNLGRGVELAIQSMAYLNNAQLWIAGTGDLDEQLRFLTRQLQVQHRVKFWGQIPLEELSAITSQADLGLSLEENLGLNYRFALPNKLFDYVQHQIPVLVSPLPEMKKVVESYKIGEILRSREPRETALQIENMLFNTKSRGDWQQNLLEASKKLCWEEEITVLKGIFAPFK